MAGANSPQPPQPPQAAPGSDVPVLPGYEILSELGRGGMGVVYKARHLPLNRTVALKMLLSTAGAGLAELARFRREAEVLARLQHPNIVQIFDVGTHDGRPYFALEYVAGPNLEQRLRGQPTQPRAAARLVESLARAVHAVHECDVLHRDLKPANILLSFSGPPAAGAPSAAGERLDECVPKITDFGLAKDLAEAGKLTRTGEAMGTPTYMAPEQARGERPTRAVDVYALGALLYEALTGEPPFDAETRRQTIERVVYGRSALPDLRDAPADLAAICGKCLEHDPGRRYASALELAEDLRAYQEHRPTRALPVGPVGRLWRWCRRRLPG
jgi:serine/threonine protein kinase